MTCKHQDPINNSSCGSYRTPKQQLEELNNQKKELSQKYNLQDEPDNSKFEILDTEEVGTHLLLKVKYESCSKCSYEGIKILAYADVSLRDVLKWRIIDPHFSDKLPQTKKHAPSPIARFPASDLGWDMAVLFLRLVANRPI
jgi:hypothetical protein